MSNILEIKGLVVSYGGIEAVKGIDLTVEQGKIVTLIGSNGAGKSTTLKTIAGLVKPKSGSITFQGEPLLGKSTDQIVSRGVTLVPEGRRVFRMTPLHHHFQKEPVPGMEVRINCPSHAIPEPKIVTRFWIVCIFLAVIPFVTLKIR